MSVRMSSMQTASAGAVVVLDMPQRVKDSSKGPHAADGAVVTIISNRLSCVEVEMTKAHGPYSKGDRLTVAPQDILTGELAHLKLKYPTTRKRKDSGKK